MSLREHTYTVIFEADTPSGKIFDIGLLVAILTSIAVIMLDSVDTIHAEYEVTLPMLEWLFTGLFTVEYLLRLYCVRHKLRYALSFFGVVDLLAILPTYLSLFIGGAQSLLVIRVLRLLRVFRVFKLVRLLGEADVLTTSLKSSMPKMVVFLVAVATIVIIIGTGMYLIEGPDNPGFASIPQSMYWAVVTVTTVGFGDSVPLSVPGKILASILMVMGFAIIAVPTGIVTAEFVGRTGKGKDATTQCCPECLKEGHDKDALHCKYCGAKL